MDGPGHLYEHVEKRKTLILAMNRHVHITTELLKFRQSAPADVQHLSLDAETRLKLAHRFRSFNMREYMTEMQAICLVN